jgi:hypothetical protein
VCNHKTLEIAKKNLRDHFSVVGLSERFDETLILIKRKFGWRLPCYVKVNVTKNRPSKGSLSDSTLELLQEHTVLDEQLYKYAQDLFRQQIKEQGIWLRIDLAFFKFLNTLYGALRSFPPPFTQMMKSAHDYYKSISTN